MLQGSLVRFLPCTQNFFQLSLCLLLLQATDDILLLSGMNSRQTAYNQQDSRLTSKRLETALIYDGHVERTQGGTVYKSQSLFFFEVI